MLIWTVDTARSLQSSQHEVDRTKTYVTIDCKKSQDIPCVAIVLEGTLQVSWFLEVIEGRMVGSLKEVVINLLNPKKMKQ